jgi:hypothetical protein
VRIFAALVDILLRTYKLNLDLLAFKVCFLLFE